MSAPAVTAFRGAPPAPLSAAAPAATRAGAGHGGGGGGDDRLLHPLPARAMAFLLLALFGAVHWMQMIEPVRAGRAWAAVAAAGATATLLIGAGRVADRRVRAAAIAAAITAGLAAAAIAAGVSPGLLLPGAWDELAGGVARGISGLPGARVPYRGLDEWLRLVLILGGTTLTVLAAAAAFWPRRRGSGASGIAVVLLVALYAVPAVALFFDSEFVRGAALALLVLAFLRLERLRRRDAPAAATVGLVAAVAALAVAPALDRIEPWWDYETWALSAGGSRSTTFAWDHEYGPLDWPRDGRELLRVKSRARTYWKADQLDRFDGVRWVREPTAGADHNAPGVLIEDVDPALVDRWTTEIQVTLRNLRSETFVTAGTALDVMMPRKADLPTLRPGVLASTRTLRRGDAYRALVYIPDPTRRQLRRAGTDYGTGLVRFTRVETPGFGAPPGENVVLEVPGFRASPATVFGTAIGEPEPSADAAAFDDGPLARTWALSRRLLADSRTPHEYVQRVLAHLRRGYTYSERPPAESGDLDGFLFETRVGFCQQFSGAMALLLRMGGVPARVAAGFSPGSYDRNTKEYVVRDVDAHSWVEAWFPGIGWVTFDPTPSTAPPRSQARADAGASGAIGDIRDLGTATADPRLGSTGDGRSFPWGLLVAAVAAVGAAVASARAVRRRRPRRRGADELGELRRALRIADGDIGPGVTLTSLEQRFAAEPRAAAYVRALRARRFGRPGSAPTREQRRALRRALSRGGPRARLRGYWALPPVPPLPRRSLGALLRRH